MLYLVYIITITHIIALVTPGPDNLFIMQSVMKNSKRDALYGVLGITTGVFIWCVLALAGLKIILDTIPILATTLQFLGGSYLCWLAYNIIRSISDKTEPSDIKISKTNRFNLFKIGLFTNLSNIKAILYFSSIFTSLSSYLNTYYSIIITIIIVCLSFLWFTFVAFIFSLPYIKEKYQQYTTYINVVVGSLFFLFGGTLLYVSVVNFLKL